MGSRPSPDDVNAALDYWDRAFAPERQERLDLDAPAAADDAPTAAPAESEIPSTGTEAWRRECEARHVMRLPLDMRRDHYTGVRKVRGEAAMRELIAEVNRQWVRANPI
jgi:hypothetical protein